MTKPHALLTGGTGGLGSAIARQLVEEGHSLTLTYRSSTKAAEALVAEVAAAGGQAQA